MNHFGFFILVIMFYVYAIKSVHRNYIYVGISHNIEQRLLAHHTGSNKTTAPYRPFKLILKEEFQTRLAARQREKYLKGGSGKEFLKRLLESQA